MNKDDIKRYSHVKKKIFTTSEVIKDSFVNLIKNLKKEDFVIVENQRQKISMVIQNIDTFTSINKPTKKEFFGKIKTMQENILLAKTYIKENIFFLMRFEFKNITFPYIDKILNNPTTTKMGFDAKITNQLMEAYKYILNSPKTFDAEEIIKLQGIIAKDQALEWGTLRKGKVFITGTNYVPPPPKLKDLKELLKEFKNAKDKYQAIAKLLIKLIKMQPFYDGNKRTAFLTANRLLIENALGIFSLTMNEFDEFNILLNKYYDGKKEKELIKLVVNNIFNTLDKKLI